MKKYDIIIVGAGAAGVFMSHELANVDINASVLMLDKGGGLEERVCPIKRGITKTCVKCNPCHIMNGYGGAGTLGWQVQYYHPVRRGFAQLCGR